MMTPRLGVALAAILGLASCSERSGGDDGKNEDGKGNGFPAPGIPDGGGQPDAYPAGPYGISPGSVIANFQFEGYVNAVADSDAMQTIQLADFYNSTGAELMAPDSAYVLLAHKLEPSIDVNKVTKPRALLINVSAVWCGPCNYEADQILPGEYAKYKPLGGEFLLQLADGPSAGIAAEAKHLYSWVTKYEAEYPSVIDPSYKLGALFEADAFPANMIVDTRTMTIVHVIAGSPNAAFWAKFESILEG